MTRIVRSASAPNLSSLDICVPEPIHEEPVDRFVRFDEGPYPTRLVSKYPIELHTVQVPDEEDALVFEETALLREKLSRSLRSRAIEDEVRVLLDCAESLKQKSALHPAICKKEFLKKEELLYQRYDRVLQRLETRIELLRTLMMDGSQKLEDNLIRAYGLKAEIDVAMLSLSEDSNKWHLLRESWRCDREDIKLVIERSEIYLDAIDQGLTLDPSSVKAMAKLIRVVVGSLTEHLTRISRLREGADKKRSTRLLLIESRLNAQISIAEENLQTIEAWLVQAEAF